MESAREVVNELLGLIDVSQPRYGTTAVNWTNRHSYLIHMFAVEKWEGLSVGSIGQAAGFLPSMVQSQMFLVSHLCLVRFSVTSIWGPVFTG